MSAPICVRESGAVGSAFESLRDATPVSVGVCVRPSHDYGGGWLVVAYEDGGVVPTWAFDLALHDALLPLIDWLTGEQRPYVVFDDAHLALRALAELHRTSGAWLPSGYGCMTTAALLLSEGRYRSSDLPSLEQIAQSVLAYEAPVSGMDEASQLDALASRAALLLPLMRALMPQLRKRNMTALFALECKLLPAVVDMEGSGIHVDAAQFEQIARGWRDELQHASDPPRRARLEKLISTYGYWPLEYIRGDRIRCRLDPMATESGRFSCSDPNLQQVPAEHTAPGLRACFRAAPDHVLIVADYAQIELRVAAHVAPCKMLQDVFAAGADPHRATASNIAGKAPEEISDHERKLAKAVNFGFLFGMGAKRFASYAKSSYGVELTFEEAAAAKEAFFATFPGIQAWHRKVAALGRTASTQPVLVRTIMGRTKRFEPGGFSFNAALNLPVQGTAAEGFKQAMVELYPALAKLGGRGVLCVHDEYIAEVPRAHAEEAQALVKTTMERAMAQLVPSVPIVVEAEVADAWS